MEIPGLGKGGQGGRDAGGLTTGGRDARYGAVSSFSYAVAGEGCEVVGESGARAVAVMQPPPSTTDAPSAEEEVLLAAQGMWVPKAADRRGSGSPADGASPGTGDTVSTTTATYTSGAGGVFSPAANVSGNEPRGGELAVQQLQSAGVHAHSLQQLPVPSSSSSGTHSTGLTGLELSAGGRMPPSSISLPAYNYRLATHPRSDVMPLKDEEGPDVSGASIALAVPGSEEVTEPSEGLQKSSGVGATGLIDVPTMSNQSEEGSGESEEQFEATGGEEEGEDLLHDGDDGDEEVEEDSEDSDIAEGALDQLFPFNKHHSTLRSACSDVDALKPLGIILRLFRPFTAMLSCLDPNVPLGTPIYRSNGKCVAEVSATWEGKYVVRMVDGVDLEEGERLYVESVGRKRTAGEEGDRSGVKRVKIAASTERSDPRAMESSTKTSNSKATLDGRSRGELVSYGDLYAEASAVGSKKPKRGKPGRAPLPPAELPGHLYKRHRPPSDIQEAQQTPAPMHHQLLAVQKSASHKLSKKPQKQRKLLAKQQRPPRQHVLPLDLQQAQQQPVGAPGGPLEPPRSRKQRRRRLRMENRRQRQQELGSQSHEQQLPQGPLQPSPLPYHHGGSVASHEQYGSWNGHPNLLAGFPQHLVPAPPPASVPTEPESLSAMIALPTLHSLWNNKSNNPKQGKSSDAWKSQEGRSQRYFDPRPSSSSSSTRTPDLAFHERQPPTHHHDYQHHHRLETPQRRQAPPQPSLQRDFSHLPNLPQFHNEPPPPLPPFSHVPSPQPGDPASDMLQQLYDMAPDQQQRYLRLLAGALAQPTRGRL